MLWIQNKRLCQMCPTFQCDIVIYIIQNLKKSKRVTKKESQENLIVNSLPVYQWWMKKM